MARVKFELHSPGVEEVLTVNARKVVDSLAEAVRDATAARLPAGTDVVADSYTTDRAAASVTIRDASGKLWQARDGVLTRAAASLGLEIRAR